MTKKYDFKSLFAEAEKSLTYHVEGAVIEFTEEMTTIMKEKGISRSELARKIGTSPAYITKILRGSTNFTLESMVKVARALDCEYHAHLQPKGARTQWFDIYDKSVAAGIQRDHLDFWKTKKDYVSIQCSQNMELPHDPVAVNY